MARSSKVTSQQVPKSSDAAQQEDTKLATDIPVEQTVSLTIQTIHSDLHRTVYCNNVRVGISQWDLSIGVGQVIENKESRTVIQEEAMVKFSPQFFKVFVSSLTGALQQWEATFGEIPLGLGQTYKPSGMSAAFQTLRDALQRLDTNPTLKKD